MSRLLCLLLLIPAIYAVPAKYAQPCYENDYACIGRNLAGNSFCNPNVYGVMPANYTIDTFVFQTPYFNSTSVDSKLSISNHDKCVVSKFYFNLATNTVVLSIRCKNLIFESNRTLIQHYVEGEDTNYSYRYYGKYPEVILTVNLKPASTINLCTAQSFAYVSALPEFLINPNDQATNDFLSTDLSYLNIFERETFFYRADELTRYFINSMICNFGCDF